MGKHDFVDTRPAKHARVLPVDSAGSATTAHGWRAVACAASTAFVLLACSRPADKVALVFDPPSPYDWGTLSENEDASRPIHVRNVGTSTIVLDRLEASRSCRAAVSDPLLTSRGILPGGAMDIQLTCRADVSGPLRERVVIHARDAALTTWPIDIRGTVTPTLAFDAPSIDLETKFGHQAAVEVRLVGRRAREARLLTLSSDGAADADDSDRATDASDDDSVDVEARPLASTPGHAAGLDIRCSGKRPGTHVGHLRFQTGLNAPSEIGLSWSCRVSGTLTVAPSDLYFNLKDPGQHEQRLSVRSTYSEFRIRSVKVLNGPFRVAEFDSRRPETPIAIAVDRRKFQTMGAGLRGAIGRLRIVSNDPTEPVKEIALLGFGRLDPGTEGAPGP